MMKRAAIAIVLVLGLAPSLGFADEDRAPVRGVVTAVNVSAGTLQVGSDTFHVGSAQILLPPSTELSLRDVEPGRRVGVDFGPEGQVKRVIVAPPH